MEKNTLLYIFGLFLSGVGVTIAVVKFSFGGYFSDVLNQFKSCNEAIKRIDEDRKNCRQHCEQCRLCCAKDRKEDITRLYDKIEGR